MSKLGVVALCLIFASAVVCGDIQYSLCPGVDGSMIVLSHINADPWPIVKCESSYGDDKTNIDHTSARMGTYSESIKIINAAARSPYSTTAGTQINHSFITKIPP